MSDNNRKKAFWFIALLSVLVIVPFLGETIFYSKGEPREAIVGYAILESGNWILPLNHGGDIAYKPPFLYWMIAAFSAIAGGVSEFTSRLPSAVMFLAMQLVFFVFVARRKDVKTAFLTSVLLLTSFEVHRAAVACRLDMVQVSLIVMSLCLLFRWDEQGCRRVPWLAIVLMACASLTKGPVGTIFRVWLWESISWCADVRLPRLSFRWQVSGFFRWYRLPCGSGRPGSRAASLSLT